MLPGPMARKRKPTLRDVAAAAGVSLGTASNAFSKPDLLSAAMRERVLAEAGKLGYAGPDPAARRLRTGRAGALGLIFTDRLQFAFDDEAAVLFLRGVAGVLEPAGPGLLLIPTSPTRAEGAGVVRAAAVDGFIVYSTPTGDPRLEAALERDLPVITVDEPREVPTPFVGIDDRAGGRIAAQHLVELGHERIAIVSFPECANDDPSLPFDATQERLAGYREGLGAAWDPDRVVISPTNRQEISRQLAAAVLAAEPPPTAILAMSDVLAAGTIRGAADHGVDVPSELSVVGFDDIPQAALNEPPLTTVAQPTERKGEIAAQALLDALESDTRPKPTRTLLPIELVVRGTTAPPR
jgi:DNA-binding LacI/PurR family transcriptional regulator